MTFEAWLNSAIKKYSPRPESSQPLCALVGLIPDVFQPLHLSAPWGFLGPENPAFSSKLLYSTPLEYFFNQGVQRKKKKA